MLRIDETSGRLRRWAAIALVGMVVMGCGGSGTTSPNLPSNSIAQPSPSTSAPVTPVGSQNATATPATTPAASKGPATAQIALVGTSGLTGPVTSQTVTCNRPSLDGSLIFFTGTSGTSGPQIVIFVRAGHMEVRVGTGSGTTLKLRSFEGTGVTGFDAASGAQLDSTLTETTAAGSAVGDLGSLSSIKGSIDCGDQQPGTASITITGPTQFGQIDGQLTNVVVTCTVTSSGPFVGINGLGTAGGTPVLVFVTAGIGTLQVVIETKSAAANYLAKGTTLANLGPDGAHVDGDVSENAAAGTTPRVVHASGDATCGTTVHQ